MTRKQKAKEIEVKAFKEWTTGEYENYVKPGDIVDAATLEYFKKLIEPRLLTANHFQVGEDEEEPSRTTRYLTFEKVMHNWVYRGLCYHGKKEEPTN